jgi:hypothetical protein
MSGRQHDRARAGWSYTGEVWTDGEGRAVVVLPPFVRAHHAGFEYELTPVDSASEATVTEEIADGRFTISTDQPHVKVGWRVTALKEELS